MDLAQFITGLHIEQVNADLATFHTERKKPIGGAETFPGPGGKKVTESAKIVTEDYGAVLLHLSGGARGVFHVMQMHAGRKNRLYLEVCGTEGSMVWDSEAPELLWHGRRGGPNSLLNRDSSLLSPEVAGPAISPAVTPKASPTPSSSSTSLSTASSARVALANPASRPSPTATAKSGSARPSPRAPARGSGSA